MSTTDRAPIFVSVCICTRNRPDMIGPAVESVLANDYPAFELIVVDQSSMDVTKAVLQPFILAHRLRYVHMVDVGLSRARNRAINASKGTIIAFTDDDCSVPQDWLTSIVYAFAADHQAHLVYGQVMARYAPNGPQDGITPGMSIQRPERLSRKDGFRIHGMGANFGLRRHLVDIIGGFDEYLGAGSGLPGAEDFDFAYRAYRAGLAILLRPEIHVDHYGTRPREQWPSMLRSYGIGDGAFFCKHIRCGDVFAIRLLLRRLIDQGGRQVVKRLFGRSTDLIYARSLFVGMSKSLQLDVDCSQRLYSGQRQRRGGQQVGAGGHQ